MAGPSASDGGLCPVRWLNRHALVRLPERVDQSNAGQVRDELLAVTSYPVLALLVDLTGTTSCDHACGDALNRVFLRTMARGIDLRPVACTDQVLHVLSMSGLDRVVPVYPTTDAALAATDPAGSPLVLPVAEENGFPEGDVGVEMALLDARGVIVWVNSAWRAFTAANGGDPAAAGPGVSYLDVCAAAAGDLVTARVEAAIRRALSGDLPGSFTIEGPCHSPGTARWFDMLISSRLDEDGESAGATVTLSLARSRSRALLAAGQPGPGEPGRDLISGMADRLAAVNDLLEVSARRVPAPVDSALQQAISELATVIRDARTVAPELRL
jgi:anti-anti-sigma regulatory factor